MIATGGNGKGIVGSGMKAARFLLSAVICITQVAGCWSAPASANADKTFEPILCGRVNFDDDLASHLIKQGVKVESISESELSLANGCIVFAPKNRIHVLISDAKVSIAGGAIVFIKNAGNGTTAVLNLHDTRRGSVTVRLSGHELELPPGRMLIVTNNTSDHFDDINPLPGLWYRTVFELRAEPRVRVFMTQFSLPSASYAIPTVRHLSLHDPELGSKLVKTMAAVYAISRDPVYFRPRSKRGPGSEVDQQDPKMLVQLSIEANVRAGWQSKSQGNAMVSGAGSPTANQAPPAPIVTVPTPPLPVR